MIDYEEIKKICCMVEDVIKMKYDNIIFPMGACGLTARLIASYLLCDKNYKPKIVSAYLKNTPCYSHCWLVVDGVIIDATITQFRDIKVNDRYYISRDNYIHNKYFVINYIVDHDMKDEKDKEDYYYLKEYILNNNVNMK